MKVRQTRVPGVLLIEPKVFGDRRGFFMETWQQARYAQIGIPAGLVQDNQAYSGRGVLRGLHAQHPHAQGKLVQVVLGEVFDVAVDIRRGSPWFGQWVGARLSADNKHQLWVPEGFAHGYCVLSATALFSYKCSQYYRPESELSVRWDDPDIGIDWPTSEVAPLLSEKDANAPRLRELPASRLPEYQP